MCTNTYYYPQRSVSTWMCTGAQSGRSSWLLLICHSDAVNRFGQATGEAMLPGGQCYRRGNATRGAMRREGRWKRRACLDMPDHMRILWARGRDTMDAAISVATMKMMRKRERFSVLGSFGSPRAQAETNPPKSPPIWA